MRSRFFAFLLASAGLAACTKEPSPLRLDFVGATRFVSSDKTVGAGDTLTTRLYAEADEPLTRLRITATYSPTRQPYAYPSPIGSFDPNALPDDEPLVFLDSMVGKATIRQLLFTTTLGARTTSGTQRWEFTASDTAGRSSTRAFRLTVRKADSLETYHDYTLKLSVPATGADARRFLSLRPGLALPRFSVYKYPENQGIIDLVQDPAGLVLTSADSAGYVKRNGRWTGARRHTVLRPTGLVEADFTNARTAANFMALFNSAADGPTHTTGTLRKDQIFAFRTQDQNPAPNTSPTYGLLRVLSVPSTTAAGLQLAVRVGK